MSTVTPHTEIINDLLRLAVDSGARDVMGARPGGTAGDVGVMMV
jgi:hypothetical protein